MITEQSLITLMLAIIIASVAALEIRNLKYATYAYLISSIFLCGIIVSYAFLSRNESLYLWAITCVLIKVIIVPRLLIRYIRMIPQMEHQPVIGLVLSVAVLVLMLTAFYRVFHTYIAFFAPTDAALRAPVRDLLAGACTVFMLGIWTLLSRRDVIKTVIGLVLMENGVHLILLALAPQLKETTMIGILTNVVAVVFILLYLSADIYRIFGTTDSARLSELKR